MQPLAYWALAHWRAGHAWVLRHGKVERPGATRVEMQDAVADAALTALVAYLRESRG